MSEYQYAELQKKQYAKDSKLLDHFKQSKDLPRAKLVFERLQTIKAECDSIGITLSSVSVPESKASAAQ